ncbi:hypothetical protein FIBSPDRAFT_863145 [Athelia psychrophila]|uniref:Uncharacterized protein n=1 Tax=Athelia psychrophila TaxID=1759441 RepID=A0A166HT49_9AGAM|nr:hypothetical protein FIBSPDRAFT_863145 [Fibularhizoctonia sp. CBS 109695]
MSPCGTVILLTFHVLPVELNELDRVESRTTVRGVPTYYPQFKPLHGPSAAIRLQ